MSEGPDIRGSPRAGLIGATVGFFFGFAAVALFGPTATRLQDVMAIGPGLVGLLVAMPMLSGSLLRIPFSAWVEKNGGRKPFLVLMTLSVVGMLGLTVLLTGLYPSGMTMTLYPVLVVLGLLCGSGIATFSVGISQVSYWYPEDSQGWALGAYAGFGNIAPGIFSFLIPLALASYGLTWSYVAWLAFLVIGTALYYRYGRNAWYFQLRDAGMEDDEAKSTAEEEGQELFPTMSPKKSLVAAAKTWKTWPLVALYFTTFGGFLALTAWYPTYWELSFGTTTATAGLITGIFSVYASLIRVPGGSLSDRIGGLKTAALALTALLLGSAVMTVDPGFPLAVAGTLMIGTGMGVNNAAVFKEVPKEVPEAVGGAVGWVGGLGAFGGFVLPPVMGGFVSRMGDIGYARGFSVFAALAVVALVLVWVLNRSPSPAKETPAVSSD